VNPDVPSDSDVDERFRIVFAATYDDVVRFVQRRSDHDHAEDVAAEAFATAWRRVGELPVTHDEARAWLFGIARRTLLNHVRGQSRQHAVAVRIADTSTQDPASWWDDLDGATARIDFVRAWRRLSPSHQEVLALTGWDGLTTAQAAAALGISPVAVRLRLSRARRVLRSHLDAAGRAHRHPRLERSSR